MHLALQTDIALYHPSRRSPQDCPEFPPGSPDPFDLDCLDLRRVRHRAAIIKAHVGWAPN
jgi:hypothetical protein